MTQATQLEISGGRAGSLIFGPSEATFRRLLEKLPAGAYMCNADGLITYYNRKAVEVWGRAPRLYDPRDRYCGSFKLYSVDGEPLVHERCWMALAIQNRRAYEGEEIVVERPDGSRRIVLAHANPVHDEGGRLLGAVNVLVDISEREETARRLQQLNKVQERSEERRTSALLNTIDTLSRQLKESREAEEKARKQAALASMIAVANTALYRQMREQKARLEHLGHRIIQSEEAERKKISEKLHESVGQMVTALLIELSLLRESSATEEGGIGETLASLNELTTNIHDDVRHVSHLLRPPAIDIIGLGAALYSLCEHYARLTEKEIVFSSDTLPPLSEDLTITFYRFVQEALENVREHSQASLVTVGITYEDELFSITVEDNGTGFDASQLDKGLQTVEGIGLLHTRERLQMVGADLEIETSPGQGARVRASRIIERKRPSS